MEANTYRDTTHLKKNVTNKNNILQADIIAHEDRINDMNAQAESLIESGQFDSDDIKEKRDGISKR